MDGYSSNPAEQQSLRLIMRRLGAALLTALLLQSCASHQAQAPMAAVATSNPLATQAALRALDEGGNAFDAAVAAAAVLGVVEPYGSGLGGGSFWLLRKADGETAFVDGREIAPQSAHANQYLDDQGKPRKGRPSLDGALAAAIPGQPAALAYVSRYYGERSLSANLSDAVRFASLGFRADREYLDMLGKRVQHLATDPGSRQRFLVDGQIPKDGQLLQFPELALTLEQLGRDGHEGFYFGPLAKQLVDDVNQAGGAWTEDDLAAYQVLVRRPVTIRYQGAEIITAPPPSAGGMALAQMFRLLETAPVPADAQPADRVHHLSEIMRLGFRNRDLLGDPDFVKLPWSRLMDRPALAEAAASIRPDQAAPAPEMANRPADRSEHTTHLSIVDAEGNAVAATLTINLPFGAAFTSPHTGILLNSEMDDFAIAPGVPNAYGLPGSQANRIEPGKRPLSSMSPSMVLNNGQLVVLGSPGGSRIISTLFLSLLDIIEGQPAEAVAANPRWHHQYLPHEIQAEPAALENGVAAELAARGHRVLNLQRSYGDLQLVTRNLGDGSATAVSDPRGNGQAIARSTE